MCVWRLISTKTRRVVGPAAIVLVAVIPVSILIAIPRCFLCIWMKRLQYSDYMYDHFESERRLELLLQHCVIHVHHTYHVRNIVHKRQTIATHRQLSTCVRSQGMAVRWCDWRGLAASTSCHPRPDYTSLKYQQNRGTLTKYHLLL